MPGPPLLIGQREVGRLIHAIPSSGDFGGLDQPHDATDSDPPVEPDAEETDEDGKSKPGQGRAARQRPDTKRDHSRRRPDQLEVQHGPKLVDQSVSAEQ